jgi:hypothetical protein
VTQDLFMRSGATIDGDYRFKLWRNWDGRLPIAAWLMCNPSTADAMDNDPTIRRIIDFTRDHGCGGLIVVNVWPFRSPYPEDLWRRLARFGYPPEVRQRNLDAIIEAGSDAKLRFVAFGAEAPARYPAECRVAAEALEVPPGRVMCLATSKDSWPRHPLYLPNGTPGRAWSWPNG